MEGLGPREVHHLIFIVSSVVQCESDGVLVGESQGPDGAAAPCLKSKRERPPGIARTLEKDIEGADERIGHGEVLRPAAQLLNLASCVGDNVKTSVLFS